MISIYWGSLMSAFYTGDRSWVIFYIRDRSWVILYIRDRSWAIFYIHDHSWAIFYISDRSWAIFYISDRSWTIFYILDRSWVICISMIAHERFAYRWFFIIFDRSLLISMIAHYSFERARSFWAECTSHSDRSLQWFLLFSLIYERSFFDEWFCNIPLFPETVTMLCFNHI